MWKSRKLFELFDYKVLMEKVFIFDKEVVVED